MLNAYLNISMVSSENLACSHAEPTMRISWRLRVIWGDRSHGGVVSGDNLEPEPLPISRCSCAGPQANAGARAFTEELRMWRTNEVIWGEKEYVCACVSVCDYGCMCVNGGEHMK